MGIVPGSDDVVGPRREFARRFTERIWNLAGNTPGDHQKKTGRLTARMPEATRLAGLTIGKLLRSVAEPPVLGFWMADDG
ncbi:hypothetical protein BHM03_00048012 [Ensete ventricosum]|nr:hypothetical protein BHM03_00048012 [Ensete ventricosum]